MSPREKNVALLSALGVVGLAFYYIPTFLYATLTLAGVCGVFCCCRTGAPLPARLGLNPRTRVNVPAGLRRLWGRWVADVSAAAGRGRTKSSISNRAELRDTEGLLRERQGDTVIYRRQSLASDSFLFSPRDFLMGSYLGKPESPNAAFGRPRAARNPREQLREHLSRPNHAVCTPNRRLSFAGEPPGSVGRFTITPQRHYPLQQPGVSPVGILPPVRWDGFRKKSILTPRNSPAALSPVTVKIARPDHNASGFNHLSCTPLPKAPADPCSRESVLKVLKESRKREVEPEERSFTNEQKSKRRRNDSGGSAHSAFEPLLPNGSPSQLVPKPGSLKRGMTSVAEESTMKRSRTSSISSGSGVHASRGTPGTKRNPIHSSYSSSIGLVQWKKPSAPSSPMSSPGSSRSQTPEGATKRPREDDGLSPSSASSARSDKVASEKAPVASKPTPAPKVPFSPQTDAAGGCGKRKRKIQLVSSHRGDHISLPPPPELGYTITSEDLDEEKKAAISKIQKVLETPAPEPEKVVPAPAAIVASTPSSSSTATTTASITTLSSLLAAPLPKTSAVPVINLDPSPAGSAGTTPAAPNPLLEALKMKSPPPASSTATASTPAVGTATAAAASFTAAPVQPSGFKLKMAAMAPAPQPPPASQAQPTSAGVEQPSAFTQVLGQLPKPPSSSSSSSIAPSAALTGLFGSSGQTGSPAVTLGTSQPAAAPVSSSQAVNTANLLLSSGFKPIFASTTSSNTTTAAPSSAAAPESKPPAPTFNPIFGSTSAGAAFGLPPSFTAANPTPPVPAASTASIFGGSTSGAASIFGGTTGGPAAAPPAFPGLSNPPATTPVATTNAAAQPAVKSCLGSWSTASSTSVSSAPAQAPAAGSSFQFGTTTTTAIPATVTTAPPATSSGGTFAFGAAQPDAQTSTQKVFAFGQPAPAQNTTTASFGGHAFTMASAASSSTAAAAATQSTFTFGKSSFESPAAQSIFSSSAAQPKPFAFGSGGAASTVASNPNPAPFTFGAAPAASSAATTASTFTTPSKPVFGGSTAAFTFGGSTVPSVAPPSFGAAAQTQSSSTATFTFGSAAPQQAAPGPAQLPSTGFNFGAAMPAPQFGTPVASNPAPQIGAFNFGAAATDKPAFGTSTPAFGQTAAPAAAGGPVPFGSPATPAPPFNAVAFGSPATPSFSIGAGSKPSARHRLQARRHNRKK